MLGLVELLVEGEADVELATTANDHLVSCIQGCLVSCSVNSRQYVKYLNLYRRSSCHSSGKVQNITP